MSRVGLARRVANAGRKLTGPDTSELEARLKSDSEMRRLSSELTASLGMPFDAWYALPMGQRPPLSPEQVDRLRALVVRGAALGG